MRQILLYIFFCFYNIGFSQTSKYVEIIETEIIQKTPLLLDANAFVLNKSFDSFKYSKELKLQSKNFNLYFGNTSNINNSLTSISLDSFKKEAFTNFNINYKRSELKRLLPSPPDMSNFCPEFLY